MKIFDILDQIKSTKSTNDKQNILKKNSDNILLKEIFRLVYTKQINFGVRNVPELFWVSTLTKENDTEDELQHTVFNVLPKLYKREFTGNSAIDLVGSFKESLDNNELDIIRRILGRNLECGVGTALPNKVWKNLIPEQPQMLCNPCNQKNLSRIKYPAYSQVKEDGARAFTEIDIFVSPSGQKEFTINFMTRNSNTYPSLPKIENFFLNRLETLSHTFSESQNMTFDGELVVMEDGKPLPREIGNGILNKALKGTASSEELDLIHYKVWDTYINYEEDKRPYAQRFAEVEEFLSIPFNDCVSLVDSKQVYNEDEARLHSIECIERGLEGTILKNRNFLWQNKRSPDQVKFKEEILVDLEVVGFIENKSVDHKGTLGSLTLASRCGKILVNCGSGFTNTREVKGKDGTWSPVPLEERPESDREHIWLNRDEYMGRIVEVKCNALTTSEGRETYSLFLPIFMRFRDDKDVANTVEEVFSDKLIVVKR